VPRRRDKHDRMLPSLKMERSIRTPDTRCLSFPCKIPANLLYNLAWITALATRGTQQATRVLKPLFSPVPRSRAGDVCLAEHGIRSVKIPVAESPVV
jgi:hypothetical protein